MAKSLGNSIPEILDTKEKKENLLKDILVSEFQIILCSDLELSKSKFRKQSLSLGFINTIELVRDQINYYCFIHSKDSILKH